MAPTAPTSDTSAQEAVARAIQHMLFEKIVASWRKVGRAQAGNGWLHERPTEMGGIDFEHADDAEGVA